MWPVISTLIKPEGLLNVAGSDVHYKSDNISETVQEREISCYYRSLIKR